MFCTLTVIIIIIIIIIIRNNIVTTDDNVEHVHRKFTALCFTSFFPHITFNYAQALQLRKLHTLQVRRLHCDCLLHQRHLGTKCCPSLIANISFRVASCRIRNFTQFSLARKNCPSTTRVTAANLVRDSLRAGRSGDRIPVGARFSAPVQTGIGAHPASCTMVPVLSRG